MDNSTYKNIYIWLCNHRNLSIVRCSCTCDIDLWAKWHRLGKSFRPKFRLLHTHHSTYPTVGRSIASIYCMTLAEFCTGSYILAIDLPTVLYILHMTYVYYKIIATCQVQPISCLFALAMDTKLIIPSTYIHLYVHKHTRTYVHTYTHMHTLYII